MVEGNPEVEGTAVMMLNVESHPLDRLYEHFSDWMQLKRAVAWLIRFKCVMIQKIRSRIPTSKNDMKGVPLTIN